jgi:cell division control protein 24
MSTIASRKKSIISTSGVSIEQPVANKNLLNAAASESLYQQCSRLRSKMLQIPSFSKYFALASNDNPRSSTDPVTQLWDCLALGVPLCALYNLRPPPSVPIPVEKIDTDPDNFDPNNDKVRKRAIALFSMYTKSAFPDKETFIVTDLTGTRETSDGFTKVSLPCMLLMLSHIPL